jgi:hypothetical protein
MPKQESADNGTRSKRSEAEITVTSIVERKPGPLKLGLYITNPTDVERSKGRIVAPFYGR